MNHVGRAMEGFSARRHESAARRCSAFGTAKHWLLVFVVAATLPLSQSAIAFPTYAIGHIINVTFVWDGAFIHMDGTQPDNCGTNYWMKVPSTYGTLLAFVLTIWTRGDEASVGVAVYTSPPDASGYCLVNQIDPDN